MKLGQGPITFCLFLPARRALNALFFLVLVLLSALAGCTGLRNLPEGEQLYTGAEVEIRSVGTLPDRSVLKTELENVIRPSPNFSLFGMRPLLWFYQAMGDRERGIRNWLRNRIGEPPVLMRNVDPGLVVNLMENRLHNRGYFEPEVSFELEEKERQVSIKYLAEVVQPYRINEIFWPVGDTLLNREIRETSGGSLLNPGDQYNLQIMMEERERIDMELKNRGYFYFNPEFIIFRVDSTLRDRTVNVYVRVKQEAPAISRVPYSINNIIIDTNHTLSGDTLDLNEAYRVGRFHYIPDETYFRARPILRSTFLEHGQLYSREDHLLTLSRLMGLNVFQYVNARFTQVDTMAGNYLDARLFLTPMLRKSLRAELVGTTKSTGFAGPGINVSFRNRNAFGGAELLQINGVASYESLIASGQLPLTSFEFGVNGELQLPRFIAPFNVPNIRSEFVPRTRFMLGVNFLNRVQFFQMNSYNASYGYIYRPHRFITHEFTPINLQYVHLINQTPTFQERLAANPFLRRSFQDQSIIGAIYNFIYNTQILGERRHHFHINLNLDTSGNLISLLSSAVASEPRIPPDQVHTIFGSPFSQYSRAEVDLRYYYRPGIHPARGVRSNQAERSNTLAFRFIAGVGLPYGNSTVMPYLKQFFIGGPNSIRAFRPRAVGPGTYRPPAETGFFFFDQTGEVKLEGNVEYRFGLMPFLKGAVFVDAGNIWMTGQAQDDIRGEVFNFRNFANELAVGTGFGLRVDAQIFVLRFDLGLPVRVPYLPPGQRTVIDDFSPLSPQWRRENLILNIAVGYPF
jgi:hypothetical protein